MLRFLQCKHVALFPMKTMQEFKFLAFVNIFLQTRDRKKKIVLNIEQWKNERKVVWNLSEFVKTFMITQKKECGLPV